MDLSFKNLLEAATKYVREPEVMGRLCAMGQVPGAEKSGPRRGDGWRASGTVTLTQRPQRFVLPSYTGSLNISPITGSYAMGAPRLRCKQAHVYLGALRGYRPTATVRISVIGTPSSPSA